MCDYQPKRLNYNMEDEGCEIQEPEKRETKKGQMQVEENMKPEAQDTPKISSRKSSKLMKSRSNQIATECIKLGSKVLRELTTSLINSSHGLQQKLKGPIMSDHPLFDTFNPYRYQFEKIEQPPGQIEPIVNTSSNFNQPYIDLETKLQTVNKEFDYLKTDENKGSLGFSPSFNVLQETINPRNESDWETVKREVEMLRQQIVAKTQFYTSLKNKFIETEHAWQQEKKGLLAQISLMKAHKDNQWGREDEGLADSPSGTISLQKAEVKRLQQQISLKQVAWNKQKSVLVNELVALRNEINQISLIRRKEEELNLVIQRQNQQIALMARDLHEGRKRQESHIANINRLSAQVQRLSLVHQKTNAMELELQRLNLQLARWYQKGDKVEGADHDFSSIAAEENIKFLQKRVYILQSANYNLSEQIKRNRQTISSQGKLQETVNQLKIELVKQQIEKQNAINEVELLRQQLKQEKQKKQRKQKKKKSTEEAKLPMSVQNTQAFVRTEPVIVQQPMLSQQYPYNLSVFTQPTLRAPLTPNISSYDTKIRLLREETKELKNSLKEFE